MAKSKAVVLSRGAHAPGGEFCLMEHISVRAELSWSDHPECTHPVLGAMARPVNDHLDDGPRQELLELEDDLMACPPRPGLEPALSAWLAIWRRRRCEASPLPHHMADCWCLDYHFLDLEGREVCDG